MEVQAICHSALLVRDENTTVLIDPWIKGTVFMGGWQLNPSPLEDVIQQLPPLDYIYLTHEHSDHTHIGSLKSLFEGPAKNATILIPRFMTSRFLHWLRGIFPQVPILEMAHGKAYRLKTLEGWSYQYRNDDSTIVLRDRSGYTVLNTNDTFVKGIPLRAILKAHPEPDVLISQFSISNAYPYAYTDYHNDPKSFPWDQDDLKQYCVDLLQLAKPRMWIPYQSFVRFCRPENAFLNNFRIPLDEICAHVAPKVPGTRVVKLYPGDILRNDQYAPHPRGQTHFHADPAALPVEEGKAGGREDLLKAATLFEQSFASNVAWIFRRQLRPCGFVSDDDGTTFLFDPRACKFTIGDRKLKEQHPDYSWTTTTQKNLADAFKLPWGMASLLISGSMKTEVPADHRSRDFLFWAVGLIRHTGYFNIKSCWFIRFRALATMVRRRHEAYDIIIKSIRAGGLAKGNILPRRNTVD